MHYDNEVRPSYTVTAAPDPLLGLSNCWTLGLVNRIVSHVCGVPTRTVSAGLGVRVTVVEHALFGCSLKSIMAIALSRLSAGFA